MENDDALVNDLRGHTYCCGSESGLFHTFFLSYNSLVYRWVGILYRNAVLVVSVWIVSPWRLPWFTSSFVGTSMYVLTYLDGSLLEVSLLAVVSCYPCNWEPGRGVPGCRGGLRPGCLLFGCFWYETSSLLGPKWMFHLLTCTMGFAPIKRTCTSLRVYFRLGQFTDRTMMVERQLQEQNQRRCGVWGLQVTRCFGQLCHDDSRQPAPFLQSLRKVVKRRRHLQMWQRLLWMDWEKEVGPELVLCIVDQTSSFGCRAIARHSHLIKSKFNLCPNSFNVFKYSKSSQGFLTYA